MSDFAKYVVKLQGKGCPLWASVQNNVNGIKLEAVESHSAIALCDSASTDTFSFGLSNLLHACITRRYTQNMN